MDTKLALRGSQLNLYLTGQNLFDTDSNYFALLSRIWNLQSWKLPPMESEKHNAEEYAVDNAPFCLEAQNFSFDQK